MHKVGRHAKAVSLGAMLTRSIAKHEHIYLLRKHDTQHVWTLPHQLVIGSHTILGA